MLICVDMCGNIYLSFIIYLSNFDDNFTCEVYVIPIWKSVSV